jgi:hypothetical protein
VHAKSDVGLEIFIASNQETINYCENKVEAGTKRSEIGNLYLAEKKHVFFTQNYGSIPDVPE